MCWSQVQGPEPCLCSCPEQVSTHHTVTTGERQALTGCFNICQVSKSKTILIWHLCDHYANSTKFLLSVTISNFSSSHQQTMSYAIKWQSFVSPSWLQRQCAERRGQRGPPQEGHEELQPLEDIMAPAARRGVAWQHPVSQHWPLRSFLTTCWSGISCGQWPAEQFTTRD